MDISYFVNFLGLMTILVVVWTHIKPPIAATELLYFDRIMLWIAIIFFSVLLLSGLGVVFLKPSWNIVLRHSTWSGTLCAILFTLAILEMCLAFPVEIRHDRAQWFRVPLGKAQTQAEPIPEAQAVTNLWNNLRSFECLEFMASLGWIFLSNMIIRSALPPKKDLEKKAARSSGNVL
jgi:hypothetical protein